ncbi:MAG TPA: tetratricopeptide repeat protein [Tepidisphaeraceae bacterium]|nr:tetratricopeptide repeat protein [Tepidisphaeraceae bacterium]
MLLIVLTACAMAPLFTADFTNWDDPNMIVENKGLNPPSWGHLAHEWDPRPPIYMDIYIPLTYTVWSVVAAGSYVSVADPETHSHLNPWMFHDVNILVHICSVLLVYQILKLLVRRPWVAAAGAALYAVHPVQVEPVAWISGLKDVLCGCMGLLAIWQYILFALQDQHEEAAHVRRRPLSFPLSRHYIAATIALLLALLAKPSGIVVPLLVIVIDQILIRRPLIKTAVSVVPWLMLAVPFVLLGRAAQSGAYLTYVTPLVYRPLIALDSLAFYLYTLIIPLHLTITYGRKPELVIAHHWYAYTWLAPVGVLIAVWMWRRRMPWLVAALGVYWLAVLPVLGLVPFDFQSLSTVADHYLYLAMLGPAIGLAYLLKNIRRKWLGGVVLIVLLALATASFLQARTWENSVVLYRHAIAINPTECGPYNNLGLVYEGRHDYGAAIATYKDGLEHSPHCLQIESNLAMLLGNDGKLDEAQRLFEDAKLHAPRYSPQEKMIQNGLAEIAHARAEGRSSLAPEKSAPSGAHLTPSSQPIQLQRN